MNVQAAIRAKAAYTEIFGDDPLIALGDTLEKRARDNGIGPKKFAQMIALRQAAEFLYTAAEGLASDGKTYDGDMVLNIHFAEAKIAEAKRRT